MIQLSQPDFDHLVAILEGLADWRTEQARIDLLTGVFAGSPRQRDVLRVRLDGTARQAAGRVIQHLAQFGQDEPGRETLFALTAGLSPYIGAGAPADFLRDLPNRYGASTRATPSDSGTIPGGATPDPLAVREALIQRFTLDEMHDLCFRLKVDDEDIEGGTRTVFARQLVQYLERRERLPELVDLIRRLRGNHVI